MSEGLLSQDEINALLGITDEDDSGSDNMGSVDSITLTNKERDAIGEIGNISMGTSATTLFTLLNQKVSITTPRIKVWTWDDFGEYYNEDIVAINVDYKEGLTGTNLLLLKEEDVKRITDIMMGGDGTDISGELTEIHLSAIAEAMNQMVGSSSTSMSQMLAVKVDIKPPKAFITKLNADRLRDDIGFGNEEIVQVAFSMQVGEIIDSEIMQILPISFAKEMVALLMNNQKAGSPEPIESIAPVQKAALKPQATRRPQYQQQPQQQQQVFAAPL